MQLFFSGIAIFLLCHDISASASPFGPSHPSFSSIGGGFHSSVPQHAQFAESVRDWFRDMKARIFDSVSPPDVSKIINQPRENLQEQKKIFDGLFIDMSRLSFNPQLDWGIRLGHWYLIKKEDDSEINSWRTQPEIPQLTPDDSDWPEYKFDKETGMYVPKSFNTIPTISESDVLSTELDDKSFTEMTDKEADNLPESKKSAEVLDPKN